MCLAACLHLAMQQPRLEKASSGKGGFWKIGLPKLSQKVSPEKLDPGHSKDLGLLCSVPRLSWQVFV